MRRGLRHPGLVGTHQERAGDAARLAAELRAAVAGDVDFSVTARALTTMDASNYRRVPVGTVAPRDADDVAAVLEVCRAHGTPVVARGAGTSIGGQATGTGVVLDFTRHMARLVSLDPEGRTAVVGPGLVLDRLREAARPYGLTFGPDPSTHSRCTLGGMIGNNACGAHSVAWGTTADNVRSLNVVTYRGERLTLGRAGREGPGGPEGVAASGAVGSTLAGSGASGASGAPAGLLDLVGGHLSLLRTGYPPGLPRRISGYALDALLPERGVDVARSFCGSEGTFGVLTEATVRLVPLPAEPVLVVLGYADESAAAEAAAGLLPYGPLTVEGMAADLVRGAAGLPRGAAWLFCEVDGEGAARALVRAADAVDSTVVRDPAGQRALWRIREDAAGTATRSRDGTEAWPGWEDCAVPPARLGAYLREFRALLAEFGLHGVPYGHFGDGCVHVRIDFDLWTDKGVGDFRRFSEAVADLVVAHGGSLSGEHGDGQARAELLPRMYGKELVGLFGAVKDVWDPDGGLNPGMLVRPRPLDEGLRFAGLPLVGLGREAARCVGVAKCRVAGPSSGPGVMCPSYRATGEEKHSTRGRARLLHEMALGEVVTDGWRSEEVREALDLCLSCKGCRSDCPVGVDMAAYKAEFLDRHYAGPLGFLRRPRSHWTMGRLPHWLDVFGRGLNAGMRLPFAARLAGVTPERAMPRVADRTFTSWFAERASVRTAALTLWPDTFTDHLAPEVGRAAVRVLEAAGLGVALPQGRVCCGLTYVSTGQLGAARRVMRRTLDVMAGGAEGAAGPTGPVVVLEPSCAATLRTDLPELLPDDPRAARLAASVRTFAEALETLAPDWEPPRLDRPVTGQTHCHQHAVLGDAADRRLRTRAGLTGDLAGGCCGLAGNFGFEPGHYEVSVACAEDQLLPALRGAAPEATVLADGFSCRTQMGDLAGVRGRHLAEVLAEAVDEGETGS
ncbi:MULTISPECIES: FAD-binding and (Fe-S)-binding domain-containing protein [Streptomyces]|uniref:Fe-S lactate dehydrogenase n=4 Tax=Streptomyces venezuelae TaxID=54571 RepID=F2RHC1_STRVP|nr:FAD-binding and (Fe-S)-binding domain-containing protein [Streptomyces venezuelae]APE23162.1 FAD-binding oxidoreductase [Streptomyces venezuelae]QES00542.1 FAD-binding oxidoreductase [Streptomyces venezuelae ATCC 10712]CCA57449.1 Fe-S lactate dehydrogenase [Streptomyces venezuelae ATCC 10712]